MSDYIKIKRGVGQGYVFPTDLSNLYGEKIFRELRGFEGVSAGGHDSNNARYANDSTLVVGSQQGLQGLLDEVVVENRKKGMEVNRKKTVCMVISKKRSRRCKLHIVNDLRPCLQ